MSLRILHVVPAIAPRYGGPSAAAIGMCRSINGLGHEALIATTDADGADRLCVPIGQWTSHQDVSTMFFRRALGESFKWSHGLAPWLDANVGHFDVVHVHAVFSHASIAAGRACRKRNVPYVVRPLGTLDPWSLRHHRVRKQALFALGARGLLRGASVMHYTSREEYLLVESALPGLPPGVVVPNGVDEGFFTEAVDATATSPYVVSLSRLDPKKRLDVLIRAFHIVVNEPDLGSWRLLIAGDGDPHYVSALKEIAAAGPAAARIEFVGWQGGPDKVRLVQCARLFALPSSQENFGISVAEALAAGVPVVVTPGVNLAPEIVEAGAGWVAAQDIDAFASALQHAMRAGNRADLQRCARGFAQSFRWSNVANRLVTVYEDAVRSRQAA